MYAIEFTTKTGMNWEDFIIIDLLHVGIPHQKARSASYQNKVRLN